MFRSQVWLSRGGPIRHYECRQASEGDGVANKLVKTGATPISQQNENEQVSSFSSNLDAALAGEGTSGQELLLLSDEALALGRVRDARALVNKALETDLTREHVARFLLDRARQSLSAVASLLSPGAAETASELVGMSRWYDFDTSTSIHFRKGTTLPSSGEPVDLDQLSVSGLSAAVLRPFGQQFSHLRVLELGCGSGARARFLADCGASVTVVMPNPQDARAVAAQCAGLPNVQVVYDAPHAIPFRGIYDVVLIAGYHEVYAGQASVLDPLSHLLKKANTALATDGCLLLCGYNPLALGHFNDQRDHYGREGAVALEGRFTDGGPRLWPAAAVAKALAEAGFPHREHCALMGSLEKASLLVSPAGCSAPVEQWNLETLVRRSLRRQEADRQHRFSESRLLQSVLQAKELTAWSDGYVFLAHKTDPKVLAVDGWLASSFHISQDNEPGAETRYKAGSGGNDPVVERYSLGSLTPDAVAPYINGPVYRDFLDDLLQEPGWQFEQVLHWAALWLRCLLSSLSADDSLVPEGEDGGRYQGRYDLWVPQDLFQATPSRWVGRDDGSFECLRSIDGEKGTAPMAAVLYSGLMDTLFTVTSVAEPADTAWLEPVKLIDAVLEHLGYPFHENDLAALSQHWERVTGTPLAAPARLPARQVLRSLTDSAKVYWATSAEGFSEKNASADWLTLDGSTQTLRLPITPGSSDEGVVALRFDVANRPGCFEVEQMALLGSDGTMLWQWEHNREVLSGVQGMALVLDPQARRSCLLSRGNDPQFVLDLPENILASAAGAVLEVRLSAWPARL